VTRLIVPILVAVMAAVGLASPPDRLSQQPKQPGSFSVVEASIADLRRAMESGQTTSRAVTAQYLARIARYNGRLQAAISVNAAALDEADARDRERRQGRVSGPLHGIPIALKDNIHTRDMPTTGGALAFAGLRTPYEATLTRRLRESGAVIVAKTTMTELANWVSSAMPPGYNSMLGFSVNPYDPRRSGDGDSAPVLTPGGSSSGIGTAASLWAASVGTETSGSILNPANQTMLVGIKPTVGRISRFGVIPITSDQDTPGPMARTVADAAVLLGAMETDAPDPNDPATRACTPPPGRDYTRFLRSDGLRGARIGVPRATFMAPVDVRAGGPPGLLTDQQQRAMTAAIDALRAAGATVVDSADLPSLVATDPARNIRDWRICLGREETSTRAGRCSIVLRYGMKRDFNQWLASLGKAAPLKTLTELRDWNRAHAQDGTLRFGQDQLDASDGIDLAADRPRYEADRARDRLLAGPEGIDAALGTHTLDALLFPAYYAASIAARVGYPTVIVPFGTVTSTPAVLPGDAGARQSPFGVSFTGTACTEPRLIEIAYAFEQATKRRVPPRLE
jgi:amidase